MQFLARDLLVVDAQPLGPPRQFRLVWRLLHDDEDEKGEQARRESEADEAPDVRYALQSHDEKRRADGVEREMLPFGRWVGHWSARDLSGTDLVGSGRGSSRATDSQVKR